MTAVQSTRLTCSGDCSATGTYECAVVLQRDKCFCRVGYYGDACDIG